jgi:hypothetical protein
VHRVEEGFKAYFLLVRQSRMAEEFQFGQGKATTAAGSSSV